MAFVFGRDTGRPHGALSVPARALAASGESLDRAIGQNLLHDSRVSENRADHFYQFTGEPSSAKALLDALDRYLKHWIAVESPDRTYFSPDNRDNILPGPDRFDLGRVLNVSALCDRLGEDKRVPEGERRLLQKAESDLLPYTASSAADPRNVKGLIDDLLGWAYFLYGNRPVWCARWVQLKPYLDHRRPDSWNNAVGVFRTQRTLQILLRYSARSVHLVRPTQLDIGPYAYHFPSPPSLDRKHGGFTMCLEDLGAARGRGMVSEYIHAPRQFSWEDWIRAQAWCGEVSAGTQEIALLRAQHLDRLQLSRLVRSDAEAHAWVAKIAK